MNATWWIWNGLPKAMALGSNLSWLWRQPGASRFHECYPQTVYLGLQRLLLEFVLPPWRTFISPQEPAALVPVIQGPGSFRNGQLQNSSCRQGKKKKKELDFVNNRMSPADLRPSSTAMGVQPEPCRILPGELEAQQGMQFPCLEKRGSPGARRQSHVIR